MKLILGTKDLQAVLDASKRDPKEEAERPAFLQEVKEFSKTLVIRRLPVSHGATLQKSGAGLFICAKAKPTMQDRAWLEKDLSRLGEFESYDFQGRDPYTLGQPVKVVDGQLVIEGQ